MSSAQGAALETEVQRRQEAEKRAAQAAADLAKFASVKQETRGMVITLSGSHTRRRSPERTVSMLLARIGQGSAQRRIGSLRSPRSRRRPPHTVTISRRNILPTRLLRTMCPTFATEADEAFMPLSRRDLVTFPEELGEFSRRSLSSSASSTRHNLEDAVDSQVFEAGGRG